MGTSEDKVKLLSKDQIEAPFPDVEVEDENREEDSGHIWRFVCYALAYMVVVGVFLSAITFQNSSTDEQSFSRDAGLLIIVFLINEKKLKRKVMTTFLMLLSCSITFHVLLLAAASSEGLDHVPFLVYRFSN